MGTLKRIEKIIRESSFDNKKKKAVLKFNLGLVLTGIRTTVTVPRSKTRVELPSNSWTLSSYNNCLSDIYLFVVIIYALRHSLIQCNFCTAAENISGPVMLEQYVAIADYKKQNRNEVSMVAGDIVEVIDKNENGKFCILYFLSCPVFERCYIL